jgi:hypothetical protein
LLRPPQPRTVHRCGRIQQNLRRQSKGRKGKSWAKFQWIFHMIWCLILFYVLLILSSKHTANKIKYDTLLNPNQKKDGWSSIHQGFIMIHCCFYNSPGLQTNNTASDAKPGGSLKLMWLRYTHQTIARLE